MDHTMLRSVRLAALFLSAAFLLNACTAPSGGDAADADTADAAAASLAQPPAVSAAPSRTPAASAEADSGAAEGIEGLADSAAVDGYAGADGYYRFAARPDGTALLLYTDFAAQKEIPLCSQPNCTHDSESCTAWYPTWRGLHRAIPVGGRVVVLHGGSPSDADWLGEDALAQVELIDADGGGRTRAAVFPAGTQLSTLPRGGLARDAENVYFVMTTTAESGFTRALYAVNAYSGDVAELCSLPEPEERIVGGCGTDLVVTYTPGAYDMSLSGGELTTQVARLDPATGSVTPLFTHPFVSAAGISGGIYAVLTADGILRHYELETGALTAELSVELPPEFDLAALMPDGLFDGKLFVHSYRTIAQDAPSQLCYCAVDIFTGEAVCLNARYTTEIGDEYPCVVAAEHGTDFLVTCGQTQSSVSLPNGEQTGATRYTLALADKETFLSGGTELREVASGTEAAQ